MYKYENCDIKIWNRNIYKVMIDLILMNVWFLILLSYCCWINFVSLFDLMSLCQVIIKLWCIVWCEFMRRWCCIEWFWWYEFVINIWFQPIVDKIVVVSMYAISGGLNRLGSLGQRGGI